MTKKHFKKAFLTFLKENRINKQFEKTILHTDEKSRLVKYNTIESYLTHIPVVHYMESWCSFNYQNNGSKLYLLNEKWKKYVMNEVKNAHQYIFYSKEVTNEGLSGEYVCTLNYKK